MKKLNPVNIKIEGCMDADDLGHRLVDCCSTISDNVNVVNLVKIHLGDRTSKQDISNISKRISDCLKEMGASNCVFVPIVKGYIEDITIDYIEVIDNESDN